MWAAQSVMMAEGKTCGLLQHLQVNCLGLCTSETEQVRSTPATGERTGATNVPGVLCSVSGGSL